jgi:hypothetical protein
VCARVKGFEIGMMGIVCLGLFLGCASKSEDINNDGLPDVVQLRCLDMGPGVYVVLSKRKNPDGSATGEEPKRIMRSGIIFGGKPLTLRAHGKWGRGIRRPPEIRQRVRFLQSEEGGR